MLATNAKSASVPTSASVVDRGPGVVDADSPYCVSRA